MKIKRRWKVMLVLPMFWLMVGLALGIPLYEHGFDVWIESYRDAGLLFAGWFIGTLLGVVLFMGAISAEERENKEFKFEEKVNQTYNDSISYGGLTKLDALNHTAIECDLSPSEVKRIVNMYEAED